MARSTDNTKASKMTAEQWKAFEERLKQAMSKVDVVISSTNKKGEGRSIS